MYYKQVELSKKVKNGHKRYVSYIPACFAIESKYLQIKDEDGSIDTFQVTQVFHTITEKQLLALSTAQRKFKYVLGG